MLYKLYSTPLALTSLTLQDDMIGLLGLCKILGVPTMRTLGLWGARISLIQTPHRCALLGAVQLIDVSCILVFSFKTSVQLLVTILRISKKWY